MTSSKESYTTTMCLLILLRALKVLIVFNGFAGGTELDHPAVYAPAAGLASRVVPCSARTI